jgi:hypothetical protein
MGYLQDARVVKVIPAILWHKEKKLLEFGWLKWSLVIKLK